LSAKGYHIADNFYPKNKKSRARVEEYLSWQSSNLRVGGGMFFKIEWILPRLLNQPPVRDTMVTKLMETSLNSIEGIWLADPSKQFLISNEISIADIMMCCDLEQIRITGYNPFENRPKLEKLYGSVRDALNPIYDETHSVCYKMSKSQKKF
jgi:glutathione S-transferase